MTAVENLGHRPLLLEQLPTVELTEDDQYNPDRTRQRLFWLNQAWGEINNSVERTLRVLSGFPVAFRGAYTSEFDPDLLAAHEFFPPAQRDAVKGLIEEAEKIGKEKGFRWGGSLMTPLEHKRVGSTIYEGYFKFPNIPVGITKSDVEGNRWESYTIGEADKGRRLGGRTKLDLTTGTATDETDPEATSNSYFFLPPDQVEDIKAREKALQDAVEDITPLAISEHKKTPRILTDLERYMFGEMTTPEFSVRHAVALSRATERNGFNIQDCIAEGKRIAFEDGCWDYILTPQEIALRTNPTDLDPRYKEHPYTPLAVQDGAPLEAIKHLRKGEGYMMVMSGITGYEMPFAFRLEELGANAETCKSPTLMGRENPDQSIETEAFVEHFRDKLNVPFARPTDWYFRG